VVAYLGISVTQGRALTRLEHALASLIDQLLLPAELRSGAESPAARQASPN
jgi:hypothetical protein